MSIFDDALKYVLANENGFVNTKHDKGGATNFGITMATLARARRSAVSVQDVKELTVGEAGDIYWDYYWLPNSLDHIERGPIATCIFDIGVVRGITVAAKYAQEVCNKLGFELVIDGHIGPKSILGLNTVGEREFVHAYADRAAKGFKSIAYHNPTQEKFYDGWIARADRLRSLV